MPRSIYLQAVSFKGLEPAGTDEMIVTDSFVIGLQHVM